MASHQFVKRPCKGRYPSEWLPNAVSLHWFECGNFRSSDLAARSENANLMSFCAPINANE